MTDFSGLGKNIEELNDKVGGLKKAREIYSAEVMYVWAGYTYRYWHHCTIESSKSIFQTSDAEAINSCWLVFHSFDVEMTIDDLKEIYS